MIYLYGLLHPEASGAAERAADLQGVTGKVEVADLPSCQLIYGTLEGDDILPKRRFLLAHAHVLEKFLELGTLLPMRFGMVADSLEAVEEILDGQSAQIGAQFGELAGLVELGLRVTYDRDQALKHQLARHANLAAEYERIKAAPRAHQFEQAEFGRRLGEALDRHRTEVQHKLVAALKPHIRDCSVRVPEEEAQVLAADILVARDQEDDIVSILGEILPALDFGGGSEPNIRLIGPEPPFSFVQITLIGAREAA